MLTMHNLRCQIAGKTRLQIDTLNLSAGQLSAVIGANGAGKTTLFHAISGERRYAGEVRLHGRLLSAWAPLQRARHMAVLPQASQLSFPFTAQEVVAMGLTPLSMSATTARARLRDVMRMTQCEQMAEQFYPSLSGGERQRVQLARVLLQLSQAEQAPVLLLDEPTSAQDLGQQHHLLALVRELCSSQNYTAVAILHDLNQVMHYSDHCVLLENGRVAATGAPPEVLTRDSIETHWGYRPALLVREGQRHLFF